MFAADPSALEVLAVWALESQLSYSLRQTYIDDVRPAAQGQDLASGNLTAPALYALTSPVGQELEALIDSEFTGDGGLPRALQLVVDGGGIDDAMMLARREGDLVRCLHGLPPVRWRSLKPQNLTL